MLIKRFKDAKPYQAPNHFDIRGLRLQGFEDGGPKNFSVGFRIYCQVAVRDRTHRLLKKFMFCWPEN